MTEKKSHFGGKLMPHITKGGKFVFGWSKIQENGLIRLPDQAIQEYKLEPNSKVILISGSRTSGGFSVSNVTVKPPLTL